jgi:hypothetical protein
VEISTGSADPDLRIPTRYFHDPQPIFIAEDPLTSHCAPRAADTVCSMQQTQLWADVWKVHIELHATMGSRRNQMLSARQSLIVLYEYAC